MGIVEVIITAVGYVITAILFIKGFFDRKKAKEKANYSTTTATPPAAYPS